MYRERFSDAELRGVFRTIYERRDIRSYRPDPVPDEVLARVLEAAHHAPSVGLMQPWGFLILRDQSVRKRVHAHFTAVKARASQVWQGDRRDTYNARIDAALILPRLTAGSYDQPDGGITGILQREDHGDGQSHTHDPNVNTNPRTGQTFVSGQDRRGRPVSAQDVENIRSGAAPRSPPTGRSR